MSNRTQQPEIRGAKSQRVARDAAQIQLAVYFQVWKFPEMGIHHARRPAANEESAAMFHHEGGDATRDGAGPPSAPGKFIDSSLPKRLAMARQRARRAVRSARRANQRPQLHQRLIEMGTGEF